MTNTRKNVEGLSNTLIIDFNTTVLASSTDSDKIESNISGDTGLNVSFTKKQSNSNKCMIPDNEDEALKIKKGNNNISFDTTGNNLNVHSNLDISGGTLKTTKKIICKNIQISASTIKNISGHSISLSGCNLNVSDKYTGNTSGVLIGYITGNVSGNLTGDLTGNLDGKVGDYINPNIVNGTVIEATTNFIGELSGNIIGDVSGNISGVINAGNIYASDVYTSDKFIGNLSGTAYLVKDGLVIGDSITDLIDVDLSGSGEIITDSERSKLEGIEEGANNYSLPTASGVILGGVKIYNDVGSSGIRNEYTLSGITYITHTFSNSGYIYVPGTITCDYLIVAGGGGGGGRHGSGGGAGGLIYRESIFISSGLYPVVVGSGGDGGNGNKVNGVQGLNSSFHENVAIGGGSGLAYNPEPNGSADGGSGGGGTNISGDNFGLGTINQGNNGGASPGMYPSIYNWAGGGGAGQPGENGISSGSGNGGDGLPYSITGVSTYYAGGGGGGSHEDTGGPTDTSRGLGGNGGGGDGGIPNTKSDGDDGVDGLGGGGGGATTDTAGSNVGGDGGDGVVIIRYDVDDVNNNNIIIITDGTISIPRYLGGYGLDLNDHTFSVNTNDLSDNIVLLTGDQTINGLKTFGQNIIGNISGNATTVTNGLTTNSEVTDLSGMTSIGSGKVISDVERTTLYNISGVTSSSYSLPLVSVIPSSFTTAPTGGNITTYTHNGVEYKVHTFLSSGNFVVTDSVNCDFLVVGGGGGGGRDSAGGGGAGGVYYNVNETFSPGNYVITIGGGGNGSISHGSNGVNGSNSSIVLSSASFSKIGIGGGGGRSKSTSNVSDGGSGGGGDSSEQGKYFPGQTNQGNTYWNGHIFVAGGNNGGFREVSTEYSGYAAGGGGGTGSKGYRGQWDGNVPPSENSDTSGGRGGDGIYNEWRGDINGNYAGNLTTGVRNYAAGGGGGNYKGHTHGGRGGGGTLDSALIPGSGGGGKGRTKLIDTSNFNSSDNGVTNTGGGGGGGGETGTGSGDTNVGGDGGSGIITIRYALNGIIGGVKVGKNLSIDTNGVITAGFNNASTQNIGLVKIDNSSNIVINNNFITTKLPIISNYSYLFNTSVSVNSTTYQQLGDTGSFNKSFSQTKIFITTFINFVIVPLSTYSNSEVWFQIKIYNGDNVIATTPDISRQLQVINSDGGNNRCNTINNLSYIIDNVNITGSLNIKLFMKTVQCYAYFATGNYLPQYWGRGFFNIEFIEYD